MKKFFAVTFIKDKVLKEAGINHPVKLEYYKRINKQENLYNKAKYGISIVKTEYKSSGTYVEEKSIKYFCNDENKTNEMLQILKENYVTPIALEDVIADFY